MSEKTPQITYEQAKKQVLKTRNFYINFATYVLVNLLLLGVDILPDGTWDWSFWVISGWGLGLIFEGFGVFGVNFNFYKKWEEKKVEELIRKKKKD